MATHSMRPLVGITCDHDVYTDSRGSTVGRHYASDRYAEAVYQAGGEPYLLPHRGTMDTERAHGVLAPLHALVVSGGHFDIDPARYGQAMHPLCGTLAQERTDYEAMLLTAAWAKKMPVLGICGGMQLMVVLAGGTLFQDVRLRPNTANHEQAQAKAQPSHTVTLAQGSVLARMMQSTTLAVNSTHHQIVDTVGHLQAVAWASDGVIEAVAKPTGPFSLGVQWHPEAMDDPIQGRIYAGLVAATQGRDWPSGT